MVIPLKYNPLVKVVPSDLERLPYVPVQILYLIAQALPQPSQVFNLARVNKATWDYLQPALWECEVTYEARLVAQFGDDFSRKRPTPNVDSTVRINENDGNNGDPEKIDRARSGRRCEHGLVTALCQVCGQRIAIEEKRFSAGLMDTSMEAIWGSNSSFLHQFFKTQGMTALHWACHQGEQALPVARKAIEAAKVHQPSYIDGRDLQMRRVLGPYGLVVEIPPPLFTAVACGNTKLCEVLVEAGCHVNLLQQKDIEGIPRRMEWGPRFQIHDRCVRHTDNPQICRWEVRCSSSPTCQTAGHVALDFGSVDALGFLLDHGLDPLTGKEPLIHQAARTCDLPAVEALLGRYPEMSCLHWEGITPLHSLCRLSKADGKDPRSLEELSSVAAYLVHKGAKLEAEDGMMGSPRLTPLQYAVSKLSTDIESDKSYAAMALIMQGAVWNQFLNSTAPTETILYHCVDKAVLQSARHFTRLQFRRFLTREKLIEHSLVFAKLVKAIVRSPPSSTPDPGPARGSEPPMQAFLGAFRKVAIDWEVVVEYDMNTFAIEAVGRLLLSTGIKPDQGDVERWGSVIATNAQEKKAAEWAVSPWRELISDLPEIVGGK
jgi:ankyrin repeat protein